MLRRTISMTVVSVMLLSSSGAVAGDDRKFRQSDRQPHRPSSDSSTTSRAASKPSNGRGFGSFQQKNAPRFVPREVVVRYREGVRSDERVGALGSFVRTQQPLGLPRVELIRLKSGTSVRQGIKLLEANPDVAYAEPNFLYGSFSVFPNDTDFDQLWGLHNTGQSIEGTSGLADSDIDAPEAWAITTGSSAVKVAVVDSGVATGHPDLSSNVTSGWDFVENDSVPQDEVGHGTHVAGTIGARGGDSFGVAGVSWDVTIIPVRVLGGDGFGTLADIIDGIDYAVAQGADVVNLSLGGPSRSDAYEDVIASAPGVLFVIAAGNGGEDGVGDNNATLPTYPCDFPSANILCVAATDSRDQLATFSNYGSSVDIAAPGVSTFSATPASATAFASDFEEDVVPFYTGGTTSWGFDFNPYDGYFGSDSPVGFYANNTDSWLDSDLFSLSGKTGCQLNYWLYLDTEYDYDGLLVESTTDGINYQNLSGWTGWSETWVPISEDLSAYDGRASVGISFRLVSDESTTSDGAYVDDVSVDCNTGSFSATDFAYQQGTSMAAPHVAGAAALLLALDPLATVAEMKSALLQGADKKSGLTTKVGSGARLNLNGALGLIAPTPTPTPTPTASASPTPTPTASASPTPAPTPTTQPSDTTAPALSGITDRPDPFSPNGDGRKDKTKILWSVSESVPVAFVGIYKRQTLVKTLVNQSLGSGDWFIKWNGRNRSGRKVRNGTYTYLIHVEDAAGNVRQATGSTTVRR